MKRIKIIQHPVDQSKQHEHTVNAEVKALEENNKFILNLNTKIRGKNITTIITYDESKKSKLLDKDEKKANNTLTLHLTPETFELWKQKVDEYKVENPKLSDEQIFEEILKTL
jgi:hypothetical protein